MIDKTDSNMFGPFTVAVVTKEFRNERKRIGVFNASGQLCMHFECQEDADRHAKWWNDIHNHAVSTRIAELERHCKTLANEVLESRVQLGIEPDGEASIITLRHTVTVQEDMNYQDARSATDAAGSLDFAKKLGGGA